MVTDPKVLAEYDALTIEQAKLREKLAAIEARREELRTILFGQPASEGKAKADKPVKVSTVWDRIKREPPKALAGVVEVVTKLGRAKNAQVAQALGITIEAASLRLSRAVKEGYLRRVAQGVYEADSLG